MIAKCNECATEFKVKFKTSIVAIGTKKTYFTCPECDHEYIAYVKDGDILNRQAEVRKMYARMGKSGTSFKEQERLMSAIEKEESAISQDMAVLKQQYS